MAQKLMNVTFLLLSPLMLPAGLVIPILRTGMPKDCMWQAYFELIAEALTDDECT